LRIRQDGKTDETDLSDLNGFFENTGENEIRFYLFDPFNPFSHPAYSVYYNLYYLAAKNACSGKKNEKLLRFRSDFLNFGQKS
jgi:hypothetical protein